MNTIDETLLRAATRLEAAVAALRGERRQPGAIEPFIGYATADVFVVRGRVHAEHEPIAPQPGQSRLTNVGQMLSRFLTREVADAAVHADNIRAVSDEEGYFQLSLPRDERTGWIDVDVTLDATGEVTPCPVLIPDKDSDAVLISDIDDTVIGTGAYSLAKNLWTSFSGNALTREVFADAAVLLYRLHDGGRRPVFYVSSSPWNLHDFLEDLFRRGSVVRGPLFLRDLGLSETKFITAGHGSHKGESIDTILAANPGLPAVLFGDTGQKDAIIYRAAIERHPGRIRAVVLRTPGPGLDSAGHRSIRALQETGVTTLFGRSFDGFAEEIEAALQQRSE